MSLIGTYPDLDHRTAAHGRPVARSPRRVRSGAPATTSLPELAVQDRDQRAHQQPSRRRSPCSGAHRCRLPAITGGAVTALPSPPLGAFGGYRTCPDTLFATFFTFKGLVWGYGGL